MKTPLLIFLSSLLATMSFSQTVRPEIPQPSFSAIIVSDVEVSIAWYSDVFGFEVLDKNENEERGFKQVNLKIATMSLELLELSNTLFLDDLLKGKPQGSRVGGFFKFGFLVNEFDAWVKFLEEKDVKFRGRVVSDPVTQKRMAIILDPDDNRIQLFEK